MNEHGFRSIRRPSDTPRTVPRQNGQKPCSVKTLSHINEMGLVLRERIEFKIAIINQLVTRVIAVVWWAGFAVTRQGRGA